jgi:hypothetical protein
MAGKIRCSTGLPSIAMLQEHIGLVQIRFLGRGFHLETID